MPRTSSEKGSIRKKTAAIPLHESFEGFRNRLANMQAHLVGAPHQLPLEVFYDFSQMSFFPQGRGENVFLT